MRWKRKTKPALWLQMKGAVQRAAKPGDDAARRRLAVYASLKRRFLKENKVCAVCGQRRRIGVHHLRGRLGLLLICVEYWLPVCHPCHSWIHQHPKLARMRGFLCQEGEWNHAVQGHVELGSHSPSKAPSQGGTKPTGTPKRRNS